MSMREFELALDEHIDLTGGGLWTDDYRRGAKWAWFASKAKSAEVIEAQKAEIESLKGLINEHNQALTCTKDPQSTYDCGYKGRERNCVDCPKQYLIELEGE